MRKVSVTLEDAVAEEAKTVAGPGRLSAFVNEAVRQRLQAVRLQRLVKELDAEFGPAPQELYHEIDQAWPDA